MDEPENLIEPDPEKGRRKSVATSNRRSGPRKKLIIEPSPRTSRSGRQENDHGNALQKLPDRIKTKETRKKIDTKRYEKSREEKSYR